MDNEPVTIPLKNLCCRYCTLLGTDDCRDASSENPDKFYCFRIGKHYKGEDIEEVPDWF